MDLIFIKLILVVALLVGLGLWQLYDVNRALREPDSGDCESEARTEDGADGACDENPAENSRD